MPVDMTPEQISFLWGQAGLVSGLVVWLILSRFF